MKIYYCPKCKTGKTTFQYANKYNSTLKICCDCDTTLESTDIEVKVENPNDWISMAIYNALKMMWEEQCFKYGTDMRKDGDAK